MAFSRWKVKHVRAGEVVGWITPFTTQARMGDPVDAAIEAAQRTGAGIKPGDTLTVYAMTPPSTSYGTFMVQESVAGHVSITEVTARRDIGHPYASRPRGQRTNPPTRRKPSGRMHRLPTASEVDVYVWEERDRLHIEARERATDRTIAEWWDEDARQMFEDGFFERRRLEHSVVKHLQDQGLIDPGPGGRR